MSLHGHNSLAFDSWYRGEADTYWCAIHETEHRDESECEEISDFANGLSKTLVSDDAVDINLWRATHSAQLSDEV